MFFTQSSFPPALASKYEYASKKIGWGLKKLITENIQALFALSGPGYLFVKNSVNLGFALYEYVQVHCATRTAQ